MHDRRARPILAPRRVAGRNRLRRLPEQGSSLRPTVPRGSRNAAHDCRRSQASWCPRWRHHRAPHLGLGNDPSSARPYDRARRWDLARWQALGFVPAELLFRCGCSPACSGGFSWRARRRPRGGPSDSSARLLACSIAEPSPLISRRYGEELVRLRQAALRRARSGARLSRPLYPPRRHREQPPACSRRMRCHLPLQGLPPQRAGAVSHHDARAPTSSSGASCSTSCPRDFTASATTGCSPAPPAKPISRAPGS